MNRKSKGLRYFLVMLCYTAVLGIIFIAGYFFCRLMVWYGSESIYMLLKLAEYFIAPLMLAGGYIYITYCYFFRKKPVQTSEASAIKRLKRKIIIQYLFAEIAFIVGSVLIITLLRNVLEANLKWRDEAQQIAVSNLLTDIVFPVFCLIGIAAVTIIFFSKPFSYLLEIVGAAKQLEENPDISISLSEPIKSVQDELNILRENSNKNAAAAKEAEQRKNDLIVYLAHDLKTPLTSVIGYMTLLRDEPELSSELREKYTDIAVKKALRLEELINEFFEITRFNLTRSELETEAVNLSIMTEQLISEFKPILAENNLICRQDISPDIVISCDVGKIERVIDNLMRNAISYSYPDTEIYISLRSDEGFAVTVFENSGRTIPKEKLDRIFEQFFRADSARMSSTGGAGLGLAIAKQITELHGGSISAESKNEKIRFTVRLPIA